MLAADKKRFLDFASGDSDRIKSALAQLEARPRGHFEDHPLSRKMVLSGFDALVALWKSEVAPAAMFLHCSTWSGPTLRCLKEWVGACSRSQTTRIEKCGGEWRGPYQDEAKGFAHDASSKDSDQGPRSDYESLCPRLRCLTLRCSGPGRMKCSGAGGQRSASISLGAPTC